MSEIIPYDPGLRVAPVRGSSDGFWHQPASGSPPTTRSFIKLLFKHRRRLLMLFLLISVPAAALSWFHEGAPKYQAFAKVMMDQLSSPTAGLLLDALQQRGQDYIVGEMEIIRSYPVAERVIRRLGMDQSDPPAATPAERTRLYEEALARIGENLDLSRTEDSNVLTISYTDEHPEDAAAVVNAVLDTYLGYRTELDDQTKRYSFIEQQLGLVQGRLNDLSEKEADLLQIGEPVDRQTRHDMLTKQLADLHGELSTQQVRRRQREVRLDIMKRTMAGGAAELPDVGSDSPHSPLVDQLRQTLLQLQIKRLEMLQAYVASYSGIDLVVSEMSELKDELRRQQDLVLADEEARLQVALAEEQAIQEAVRDVTNQLAAIADRNVELQRGQLARDIKYNSAEYDLLLKEQENARLVVSQQAYGLRVRVISPAFVPGGPVPSKKLRNILISVVMGLVGSLGIVGLMESASRTADSTVALQRLFAVPVVGALGDYSVTARKQRRLLRPWRRSRGARRAALTS